MKTELTLAVPTEKVWQILKYVDNGVIRVEDTAVVNRLLENGIFKHRNELEDDPSHKQIIPYAVICFGDMVYMFHRTKKQTEARLHNLYSLGVGGHMNPWGDKVDVEYMHHELARELGEEVLLHEGCSIDKIVPVGFINDDTNEVGKVHLGVLYQIHLNNMDIEINEKEKMTGQWVKLADLRSFYPQMESWTQIYTDLILP